MDELKRRCEELRRESARLKGELAARKRANRPLQEQLALKKAQLRKALTARERGPEYEREVVHRDDMVVWSQ